MSNIDTKAPTKAKSTPKKGTAKAAPVSADATQFVEATLANAPVQIVMLRELAKTSLNARKTPATAADIEGRANSIEGAGLLQNLVVFLMADGCYGVAAGETRRLALNLLMEQGRSAAGVLVTPEFPVVVKVVDEDNARAISYAENGQRSNLTPADQLANFREMAEEGTPVEQIAAILGYRTAHVKKCLKLTTVAPQLQELLKTDKITLDQLAALAATDDHERQIQVWNNSKHYEPRQTVKALRESVLTDEVAAADSKLVAFVGLEEYKAAGGETREDLFAESVILTNPIQLETLAIAKLQAAADAAAKSEGWAWALGRYNEVSSWGEDEKTFSIIRLYPKLSDVQREEIKQLEAEQERLEDQLEGADADDEWEHSPRIEQIEARIDEINEDAERNLWADDVRAKAGVIAYLKDGKIRLQRGVMKMVDIKQEKKAEREKANESTPPLERGLSQALVSSLSAERTLAVSASLAQNTSVALALHTVTLANRIFGKGYSSVMHTTVESQRSTCLKQAEDAGIESSLANQKLTSLHEHWLSRFPQEWAEGFEWLLAWSQADVLALLAYCVSQGIDGVSAHLTEQRVSQRLAPVEKALNFQIGDWWQPTSANFFSRISKEQIVDALNNAGKTGKARDAEKLTRKEAAEFAGAVLKDSDWLPGCMASVDAPQESDESTGNADAADIDDTANDNVAA